MEEKKRVVTKRKIVEKTKAQIANSEDAHFVNTYNYDRLASMRNGTQSVIECDFDGITVPLRLLSSREIHDINFSVKRELNSIPDELKYPGIEVHFYTKKLLSCATKASPQPSAIPVLAESDIENLTPEQVGVLFQLWSDFNKECSPVIDNLTAEQIEELYEELKKKPQKVNDFTPFQLRNIALFQRNMIMSLMGN